MVKKFLGSESIQRDEDDIICFDVGELGTNQEPWHSVGKSFVQFQLELLNFFRAFSHWPGT